MKTRTAHAIAVCLLTAGCASTTKYTPPIHEVNLRPNAVRIQAPRDEVWARAVPRLGKQFFVINNLDKSSGLINVSYSGDPEKYVDCGEINTRFSTIQGDQAYVFPASRGKQRFKLQHPIAGLIDVERTMDLDGRVNLIFEEVGPSETTVTATAKYVLTKTLRANAPNGFMRDTISFNSGGSDTFPGEDGGTRCVATGEFEREVLRALQ